MITVTDNGSCIQAVALFNLRRTVNVVILPTVLLVTITNYKTLNLMKSRRLDYSRPEYCDNYCDW